MRADAWSGEVVLPDDVALRPIQESDLDEVGQAYAATYAGTDVEMTESEAIADVRAAWRGDYGGWLSASSLGAWQSDTLVGAILMVTDAPWDEAPPGPFIIDLFVLPDVRRWGIGRALVRAAQASCPDPIGLRIDDSAAEARALYRSLGFRVVD
jgi:GNAT superfamily N-acetyltransferase